MKDNDVLKIMSEHNLNQIQEYVDSMREIVGKDEDFYEEIFLDYAECVHRLITEMEVYEKERKRVKTV